ncbi:kinase-like domain-containing protein [Rhizophagus irregularis DAOM 181602=DAOM 197198]|uniref:Polo kinase CDC5 n=2 Tax=Rhizophagus irregularis TaxID=588596 RepID=A0A015JEG5_RHIIW|nr:kinase-like domain-containing protein [Rhizophagus irregularis DAOM 181602=DAOM 197198]EXX67867.1 polo kinase CDC5 [Rhizophagus irregularis DAOM 197198w]POG74110.1 kinase-like domain-containing protein [Rhizophagus irregularis DAOM 181602=DAOM 197198]|eukprot:XP_025180976.1 kinase-like domain-containing protein [Rhizophagus irregularis DAOM 181602=DAOM 197198]
MSNIRKEVVNAALNRTFALLDTTIHNNIHKHFEFRKQTLLADKSLTEDEKTEAIKKITETYDRTKILHNSGTKRICENCNQECLATLFCEYCVRNYLKANFSNWTSGNDNIDNLIQKCQSETLFTNKIIEWIPYNNLQNISYLTEGGFSKVYTANWIDGRYKVWNSKEQELERSDRNLNVILKRLENINANQSWFEEAKSHLTVSSKWPRVVDCYGLTQDPSNGNFMLVLNKMDVNLREYLQQNHNQLTWKERIQITTDIIYALGDIHEENAIHRDLHSGNILYKKRNQDWYISDFGFCGPADKPLKSIYGNLPYIAPEVIAGKQATKASDIYSFAMLMWEISSGQPPFLNCKHDCDLILNIINGIRPRIVSGTPLEYESLMKQCWDADPLKRPDAYTLYKKMDEINLYYQKKSDEPTQLEINKNFEINKTSSFKTNYANSRLYASKVHQFEFFSEPKNATEEEQEAFYSKSYDEFQIPDNIDDFNNSSYWKNNSTSKMSSIFKANSKDAQIDNKIETMQQQIKNINLEDENEIHNNPNLHSEEQVKSEIPDII